MRRFLASLSIAASVLAGRSGARRRCAGQGGQERHPASADVAGQDGCRAGPAWRKASPLHATVGHIDIRDAKGKVIGQVVYIAYTVPGAGRPVTFAFNGGPGAASVFLNMGASGPSTSRSERKGTAHRISPSFAIIRRPGSTLPISSSSTRSAPVSRAVWSMPTRPRRTFTAPNPTSNISAGSFTTG